MFAEIDRQLFYALNRDLANPICDVIFPAITDSRFLKVLVIVLMAWLLCRGGRKGRIAVLLAVGSLVLCDLSITYLLKGAFGRPRPCFVLPDVRILSKPKGFYGFPSNHAGNFFALAVVFAVFYRRYVIPLFLFASLVALSRVYVGKHYPADVLAGALYGSLIGGAMAYLGGRRLLPAPRIPEGENASRGGGTVARIVWLVLACVFLLLPMNQIHASEANSSDALKLLYDSRAACEQIRDFTAVFTKQEQIGGVLRQPESVQMKLRQKPFSVYVRWFKGGWKDREVIYAEGKYGGKIIGHQPVGPLNFSQTGEPDGKAAKQQSRRPITQAGFLNAITTVVEITELGIKRNEILIKSLGPAIIDERPVYVVYRMFTAKRDDYPVCTGVVWIDKEWMIPVKVAGYDWDDKLLGLYLYTDVRLNVGLTDKDFDIENPDYSFPGMLPFRKMKLPWPFGGR